MLVKKTEIKMAKSKKEPTKGNDKNQLNNPHDKFFKTLFTMLVVVKDYFKHFLPEDIRAELDIETLELDTNSYITHDLEEFFSDIVWKCQYIGKKGFAQLCFLFEHKSYVPDYPNVQIGDYKQGGYNIQIKMKQPLNLIVPIIVYHGTQEWKVQPFSSYFGDVDEVFHKYIDPLAYHLTNLADYSDEMIKAFNTIFLGRAFLAYKHFKEKEYLKEHFVELIFWNYDSENFEENIGFIRPFSLYLYTITGGVSVVEILKQKERLEKKLNQDQNSQIMLDVIDQLKEAFRKEGIEKGFEEGIEKGKQIAIFEAWEKGYDIELLANVFSLPTNQILAIIDELKKEKEK